jgi:integrase
VTLDRPDLARRLTVVREPRRLPVVLSVEEVTLLLQSAPGAKYKAALGTAYGAGLRVSEVVALKVGDIVGFGEIISRFGPGGTPFHLLILSDKLICGCCWGCGAVGGATTPSIRSIAGDQ